MRILITLLLIYNLHYLGFGQTVGFDNPNINLNLNKGFDIAYSYVVDNKPHLFCYDTHTGKAAFWNMNQSDKPIVSLSIGTNWDFFTVVNGSHNDQLYLLADSKGGKIKISKDILEIANNNQSDFDSGLENEQWSSTQMITIKNTNYLFRYSNVTRTTILNRIDSNTNQIDIKSQKYELAPNWDSFGITNTDKELYMLKHSKFQKQIVVERIQFQKFSDNELPGANLFENNKQLEYDTKNSWTESRIFLANKKLYLLLYSATSGDIQLLLIDDSMTHINSIYKTNWSKGWSNFNVIFLENVPYLFHHKEANGLARISKIIL